MDLSQQKEQFSKAYLHALATVAGFGLSYPQVDDDSVDVTICARRDRLPKSPKLDVQLKCLAEVDEDERDIRYSLKLKNYNDLRHENPLVPRILLVLSVPGHVREWLTQTDNQLILSRSAHWVSLRGMPPTNNIKTVRVLVPRSQRLTVRVLVGMMKTIDGGGFP